MNEASENKTDDVDELVKSVVDDSDPVEDSEEPSEKSQLERTVEAASVVPLHVVTAKPTDMRPGAVVLRRKRGRPKKLSVKPTVEDLEYHAEMQRQQALFVEADPLVKATMARADSPKMLQALKERLARMTATLEWMRIENAKTGKIDAQIVSRQVASVREIAAIELKIRELGVQVIDLRSEPIQKVFSLFISKIQEVAKDVLPEQQFNILFNRLETELDGWEEEAEDLIR